MKHRIFTFSAIAALVLSTPLGGIAQNPRQLQPNEHETNLPGATTIEAPPAGFDPITASDEDLAWYGLPPRPDQNADPDGFAGWAKAMRAAKTRIVPQLEQTSSFHGQGKGAGASAAQTTISTTTTHYNSLYIPWMSGFYVLSGATSYGLPSFYYLKGNIVVPVARQAPHCTGGWDNASAWEGIDGWGAGSKEVLQGGIEFDAYCSPTATSSRYFAWYEWFPNPAVAIPNFPIVPGDNVFVDVWRTTATQGYVWMVNLNTNLSVQVGFTPPPGVSLIGSSAEWMVEDQLIGDTSVDFGAIPFWDGTAYTQPGPFYWATSGTPVVETYGATTIASPLVIGPKAFVDIWQPASLDPQIWQ